jgi:hypothetical protein
MISMEGFTDDPIWRDYLRASEIHQRALKDRLAAERNLIQRRSVEALERWDTAHRDEQKSFEELAALEHAISAKYKNIER